MGALYYDLEEDKQASIYAWRYVQFQAYGFTEGDSRLLAERRDIDREVVVRLLRQDATHAQILGILL